MAETRQDLMQGANDLILPLRPVNYFWPLTAPVKTLLKVAQKQARKAGLKKSDIATAIRKVRKRA
jgi:hypothetical protein